LVGMRPFPMTLPPLILLSGDSFAHDSLRPGVRNAELTRLKVSDVDSQRMVVQVQGGKARRRQGARQVDARRGWRKAEDVGAHRVTAVKAGWLKITLINYRNTDALDGVLGLDVRAMPRFRKPDDRCRTIFRRIAPRQGRERFPRRTTTSFDESLVVSAICFKGRRSGPLINFAHCSSVVCSYGYSTLLRANRADIKVMQELLRHASSRVTMKHLHKQSRHKNAKRRVE
jgi:hypothetical protein